MNGKIRIMIADDHPMVIEGLVNYFKLCDDMEVVQFTHSPEKVCRLVKQLSPDILLLDYHFEQEEITGLELCKQLESASPQTGKIIISCFSDIPLVKEFFAAGARGYLLKTASSQEFIDAVHNVYAGGEWFGKDIRDLIIREKLEFNGLEPVRFTKIEKEILKLIIDGNSTREIAQKLFREKSTIDTHRKNILLKLQKKDGNQSKPSRNILHYVNKLRISGNLDKL